MTPMVAVLLAGGGEAGTRCVLLACHASYRLTNTFKGKRRVRIHRRSYSRCFRHRRRCLLWVAIRVEEVEAETRRVVDVYE